MSANQDLIEVQNEGKELIKEAGEFVRIFSSSIATSERNQAIKE